MLYNTGPQRQRPARWGHFVFLAANSGTIFLIYLISGGFPPSTWIRFWTILSQSNSLWATDGFSLGLSIFLFGVQALLLLLVWGVAVGSLLYDLYVLLGTFSVWSKRAPRALLQSPKAKRSLFAAREKTSATQVAQHSLPQAFLSTPSSFAPPTPSAPTSMDRITPPPFTETVLPERGTGLSNTMSPAPPDSMRWILRSPDVLAQNAQNIQTQQNLTQRGQSAAQNQLLNPFAEETPPSVFPVRKKPEASDDWLTAGPSPKVSTDRLANSFKEEEFPDNPFKEEEFLDNPFKQEDFPDNPFKQDEFPGNPFGISEEIEEETTLPSSKAGKQTLNAASDLLDNPFGDDNEREIDTLPSLFRGYQEAKASENQPLKDRVTEKEIGKEHHALSSDDQEMKPSEELITRLFGESGDQETKTFEQLIARLFEE